MLNNNQPMKEETMTYFISLTFSCVVTITLLAANCESNVHSSGIESKENSAVVGSPITLMDGYDKFMKEPAFDLNVTRNA